MKLTPLTSYLIWTLINLILLKYGILLIKSDNDTWGSILLVLFSQFAIVLPTFAYLKNSKDEDN